MYRSLILLLLKLTWKIKLGSRLKYRLKKINLKFKELGWSIEIYSGVNVLKKRQWKLLMNLNWLKFQKFESKLNGCADPFLMVRNNQIFVLFESIVNKKGELWAAEIQKNKLYNVKRVLSDTFHLSYPFVLKEENSFYLIPESSESQSVRLYKTIDFPYSWQLHKILKEDVVFVDTNCIKQKGVFYWFTYDMRTKESRLFYSASLEDDWKEHSKSPFKSNRNAGGFIYYDNMLLRPVQISENNYGEGVELRKIVTLNKEEFIEEQFLNPFLEKENGICLDGSHHISVVDYKKQRIIAIDGKNNNFIHFEI